MDDSDSGGLMSTEEEQSGESSGSTGHLRMEKKLSKLKMKLKGFEQVSQSGLYGRWLWLMPWKNLHGMLFGHRKHIIKTIKTSPIEVI